MKINLSIESYDIDSIEEISRTITELGRECEMLEQCGAFLNNKIIKYSDEFTSENYIRTQKTMEDYLKKLRDFKEELIELLRSSKEFIEKINRIWDK